MLKKPQPGAWRRRSGIAVVAVVLVASSYGVWALQPGATAAEPALIGRVNDEAIAVAEVHVPKDISDQIWMQGPSMYGDPGSNSTKVYLVEHSDLSVESDTEHPWKLEMRGAGSFESPRVRWTLRQGARVLQQEERALGAGPVRVDLSAVADGAESMPQITVTRMPADRVMRSGRSAATPGEEKTMTRDADGVYRRTVPTMAFGNDYGANGGRATLLLDVGADGRVKHVDIEHVEPAGGLSREQATELVGNDVYTPRVVDGKAMPSRIRVPVEVWKESPTQLEPALVTPTSTSATASTPAPAYPAQALAARQGGFVRLHLLVAVDGSVKEVRIAQSNPIGVFDAVSIEAAKKWKLQPLMKDGKPVESWMQVPITFEPERPAASEPSGAASGTPIDLRMKLDAGDTHASPRILSRSGETFALRLGENGDPDALVIEGTAKLLPDGNVDIGAIIRKGGHQLAAPRLIVRQGVPGSVVVRDEESGQASLRLELIASAEPASYADIAGKLADAR